jgi:phosphohistidine phosphatase
LKKAVIIRHAKSSWSDMSLKDIERPLNTRGNRDAPRMAELLHDYIEAIDKFYTSPATRAKSTALYFAMYYGSEAELLETVQLASDSEDCIALFSHNPKITYFVNSFTDKHIDNVPTCGIAILSADIESWSEFNERTADVSKLLFPKLVLK